MSLTRCFIVLYCITIESCALWSFSNDIESLESQLIYKLYGKYIESRWTDINVVDEVWKAHYIRTKDEYLDPSKPDILLLHGYGATSAITWRHTISKLVPNYNIYALDMPGFGRSHGSPKLLSPDLNNENTTCLYCEFYKSMLTHLQLSTAPIVVAHSFGGFIFTPCVAANPTLISKLILVAVPGYFSSNGGWDFAWSTYFSFGLPHVPIKLLGNLAFYIYDFALKVTGANIDSLMVEYWHAVHISPEMNSDIIIRKYVQHNYIYSIGSSLALVPFLNLSIPVATVYGTKDFISPMHQGQLLSELSGTRSYVIEGGNHVAYTHNNGIDFIEVTWLYLTY